MSSADDFDLSDVERPVKKRLLRPKKCVPYGDKTVPKSSKVTKKPLKRGKKKSKSLKHSKLTKKKSHKVGVDKGYDPRAVLRLSVQFMDLYRREDPTKMIDRISSVEFLTPKKDVMHDQGAVMSVKISPDGKLLASFCKVGHVKLWDLETFELLATLRDRSELDIDEFYVGVFSPNQKYIVTGGKRKDRRHWSINDNDNRILPCTIKVFDTLTGKVTARLEAHSEEVLGIKGAYFRGVHYYLSSGQDGCIWKWRLSEDHTQIISRSKIADSSSIVFNVSFLPNVGNKYFIAACDKNLKIYDFETEKLVQTFETAYTAYCDNVKFVSPHSDIREEWDSIDEPSEDVDFEYLVSRGIEELDEDGMMKSKNNNVITLHRLIYPGRVGGRFKLFEIKQFWDHKYYANSWCMNITCNMRYLVAPTSMGSLFFFCLRSGQVFSTYKEHRDVEIRDVLFHPSKELMFSCGDDGKITVYTIERPDDSASDVQSEYESRIEDSNPDSNSHSDSNADSEADSEADSDPGEHLDLSS
ncbi:hypothetical protein DSO57_1022256 [Entomophthora muscae]|uniref:Uncharacterized protein n=3 Tax=Entomophthora muscae TaxID=34485 RepID=A0ACC2RHR0_9FUNG|nr:hypothetical protein DSO57_1022256 [Entomophthora muscae]